MPDLAILTTTVELTLTPAQVAEAFWNLNAHAQADFFVHLGVIAAESGGAALDMQMCALGDRLREHDNPTGIATFCKLAQYAYRYGRLGEPAETWMLGP